MPRDGRVADLRELTAARVDEHALGLDGFSAPDIGYTAGAKPSGDPAASGSSTSRRHRRRP
jgi:hypothetical protein